jgi:hypothetical protein
MKTTCHIIAEWDFSRWFALLPDGSEGGPQRGRVFSTNHNLQAIRIELQRAEMPRA